MKTIITFLKNKQIIFLIFFLAIGVFLRLHNLKNTQWFGDPSRDILVAKHLMEYSGEKFITPFSAEYFNGLKNSPLYYWIIAFFWFLYPSEIGVISIFAFLGSLNIILAYILSKEIFKDELSLILPFFVTISNVLINQSRTLWQPNLVPFFQLICFIFLFKGLKRKHFYLLAIQLSFLTVLIHYSFLPLLIIILIFVYIDLYLSKKYDLCIKIILLSTINVFLYFLLTKSSFIFNEKIFINSFNNYFINIYYNLKELGKSFIKNGNNFKIVFLYLSFLAPLIWLIIKKKKKVTILIFILFISFFATGFYKKPEYFHYIHPYYLIILIIYTYLISQIIKIQKLSSVLLILLVSLVIQNGNRYTIFNKSNELKISYNIAKTIIEKSKNLDSLEIFTCLDFEENPCKYPKSFIGGTWFHLEKISKQKLGNLVKNNYLNYIPFSNRSDNNQTFLICNFEIKECLKSLNLNIQESKLIYSEDNLSLLFLKY